MADEFGRIKEDAIYLNEVANAKTQDDLRAASTRLAARQSGIQRDPTTGQFVSSREPQQQDDSAQTLSRTIHIAGQPVNIGARNAEELEVMVSVALQAGHIFAGSQKTEEELRAEAEEQQALHAAEMANLELRFKRGEIDAASYLKESGAVAEWLSEQGIDVERLRRDSEEKQGAAITQSWVSATEQFLARSDWPGGNRNKALLLQQLQILGLDESPSPESLEAGYAKMKAEGLLFSREQTESEALDAMVKERFGKTVAEASPQELLEVYKSTQEGVAQGDATKANQTFLESFRRR